MERDLRDRVLADARRPTREVAAVRSMLRTGVSASYVVKARRRLRDEGGAAVRPQRNRVPPRLAGHEEAIRAEMARRSGRAPRGQRALDAVPHGHWRTADPAPWDAPP